MNAREWIDAYADRLGTDAPTREEFAAILELAAEAAHASERVAAPVACWVSARAGKPLEESIAVAREIGADADDG
jgi:nucleotide-binding universal stress UspA family protein